MARATATQKHAAALRIAIGESPASIAQDLGVAPTTVSSWLRRPEFQQRVQLHEQQIASVGARNRARIGEKLEAMTKVGVEIATDREHRDAASMIRFYTEMFIPKRTVQETHEVRQSTHEVHVFEEIRVSLDAAKEALSGAQPKLLTSTDPEASYAANRDEPDS